MGTCRSRLWDENKKYTTLTWFGGGCFFGILGVFSYGIFGYCNFCCGIFV